MPDSETVGEWLLPGWIAPLIGAGMLALGYLSYVLRRSREFDGTWLAGLTAVGFVIGCAVWLVDTGEKGQVVRRLLSLLSPLMAFLPVLGLPFTVAAIWTNRTHPGAYRIVAAFGLLVSVIVSLLFLAELKFGLL